jgi:asparagine synthase (glutamine-hydrolysing)
MSGFVVGFGSPQHGAVEEMFAKIRHRGPYLQGIESQGPVIMAQSYMRADLLDDDQDAKVPCSAGDNAELNICWDGEIGNLPSLAATQGTGSGTFATEGLLLSMYQNMGPDLLEHLGDAIFALVISDGKRFLAARDLLGIKTLFYGRKDGALYLASELKALAGLVDKVLEFPAGHYMDKTGELHQFASLSPEAPALCQDDVDTVLANIRNIVDASFANRVHFRRPTASLLSGGVDSSVIAALAAKAYRREFGDEAKLHTFALGVGESEDIKNARLVAQHIGSEHHELIVSLEDLLEVLPEVIYHLENFDPSLVRSAAANYLISRYAREMGYEVLLSGEGGDEVFCGYQYLKDYPPEEIYGQQIKCLGFLHNNASLRLDRMNNCHGLRVVTPFISGELLSYALTLPPDYKMKHQEGEAVEKWIMRMAFQDELPHEVAWRLKQEFSQGSGSAGVLPKYFEDKYSDDELAQAQAKHPVIRSKEEMHYFNLFTDHFGDASAVETVGQWLLL